MTGSEITQILNALVNIITIALIAYSRWERNNRLDDLERKVNNGHTVKEDPDPSF